MAAAFRSVGFNAAATPDSNEDTLELGGLHSSGEECLPHRITLGDFLRITRQPDFDPRKVAFFMPGAPGPCRFGQYAPYLRQVLHEAGLDDILVLSPNSDTGYGELGDSANDLMHTAWLGIVLGDLANRLLLKTRPYARRPEDADEAFRQAVDDFAENLAVRGLPLRERTRRLTDVVIRVRDRFHNIPADYVKGRPLIGLVGEIFCRLNTFSNEDVARKIEQLGGECWASDITEWIWYTNWCRQFDATRRHGRFSLDLLKFKIKDFVQHRFEHALLKPCQTDFVGYEEPPSFHDLVELGRPYLPATGAHGEMSVSVAKAIWLYQHGADGIIDISPFTCMNGIVSEAVYPAVSADHDDLPVRVLYFDRASTHIERDLEIFLDLARAYQRRKQHPRRYPEFFRDQ